MKRVKKAVIPAAGLGTRFYPLTRAQPKEMLPIVDRPVIHYVVEEAVKSGLDEILIVIGKGKEAVINYFDSAELTTSEEAKTDYGFKNFPNIVFVRQREQKGLADAISYSKDFVGDDPFVVLLGDTIYTTTAKDTVTKQLIHTYEKKEAPVIAIRKVSEDLFKNYGIIAGKEVEKRVWLINDAVEKPEPKDAPSNMGITGLYLLESDIFDYIKKLKPGKNGEYQLTDALKVLCKEKKLFGYEIDGTRYDIGNKKMWIDTFIEFAQKDPRFK